jgi:hypothetical protein
MNNMNDPENESVSKELEEALKSFASNTKQVPAGYFDQFELDLMQKIKATGQAPLKVQPPNNSSHIFAAFYSCNRFQPQKLVSIYLHTIPGEKGKR